LMGNLFVDGEQDVTQASRWVEITPMRSGTTGNFTFNYPNGSGGQLNFRTIPNLAQPAAGPYVTNSTPSGNTFGPVDHVRVTFNTAVDASTFTTGSITSFTRTNGSTQTDLLSTLIDVTPVGSDGKTFDVTFQSQGAVGTYRLTFGPNVLDLSGNPMDQNLNGVAGQDTDTYTATFTIQ